MDVLVSPSLHFSALACLIHCCLREVGWGACVKLGIGGWGRGVASNEDLTASYLGSFSPTNKVFCTR